MFAKLKQYSDAIGAVLLLILSGAFLYEKSRKDSAEAVADNQETLEQVAALEKQKTLNDAELKIEEEKRVQIEKDKKDAEAAAASDDPAAYLNKHLK